MSDLEKQQVLIRNKFWLISLIVFGISYCLLSLVDHYFFRTYAHDLGMENNAAFDYAHFRMNDCMLMQPQYTNYLSDHFSLDLIFISPVIYLFGSYGLLIAQIAFILIGGWGIYKYVLHRSNDLFIANMALIHFFSFWGIYTALTFDFHDNVIGTMAVPWLFYFVDKKKIKYAIIAFVWLLLSKENMGLWAFSLLTGMAIIHRKDRKIRNLLLAGSVIGLSYFFIVVTYVIPALANGGRSFKYLQYSSLGNSFGEIITTLIKAPHLFFDLLFTSPYPEEALKPIKLDFHMFLFLSGGFALLYKPNYLWMALPLLAQKLLNDNPVRWGVGCHYNIEFAAILPIAVYEFINSYILKNNYRRISIFLATILGLITTYSLTQKNKSLYFPYEKAQFYSKQHYQSPFDIKELNNALKIIPADARVCASEALGAHLALRDYIYVFPYMIEANYIAILMNGNYFPLTTEPEMFEKLNELRHNPEWDLIYEKNLTLIFKKKVLE